MANCLPDQPGHACFENFKLDSDAGWHFVLRFAGSAYIQRPQGRGRHPASIDAAKWSRYLDAETLQGDTGNDLALAQFAGAHTTVKQAALLWMLAFRI
jgi:hypothetical protein